jgi:pyruvate/2-oxoglutarate dehydrogenase complex dihydrolipoamide acyltransferase (E2) component
LGLRTGVTGKVIRYLQDNGADVKVGEPFVEIEAMKMSMPIKATESGKITQNLSPGSVINAGDLLGSLELKDPSKVKKILPFDGDFNIEFTPHTFSSREALFNILALQPVYLVASSMEGEWLRPCSSNIFFAFRESKFDISKFLTSKHQITKLRFSNLNTLGWCKIYSCIKVRSL